MSEPYIVFQVDHVDYAVPSAQVQQVDMIDRVTFVPNAPHFVEGVVSMRGQIVPVVSLRRRFSLPVIPYDIKSRLLVVRLDNRLIGLAADQAREFIRLEAEQIAPPPEGLEGPGLEYLEGVVSEGERLILVVNLRQLLTRQEKESLNQELAIEGEQP
jgi:purine-binding chemotaxis protein CheW